MLEGGAECYRRTGVALPDVSLERARERRRHPVRGDGPAAHPLSGRARDRTATRSARAARPLRRRPSGAAGARDRSGSGRPARRGHRFRPGAGIDRGPVRAPSRRRDLGQRDGDRHSRSEPEGDGEGGGLRFPACPGPATGEANGHLHRQGQCPFLHGLLPQGLRRGGVAARRRRRPITCMSTRRR